MFIFKKFKILFISLEINLYVCMYFILFDNIMYYDYCKKDLILI